MKLLTIALILYLSLHFSNSQDLYLKEWDQWKNENNKKYLDPNSYPDINQEWKRYNIFRNNSIKIKEFNAKNLTFKIGLNAFSDLNDEELNTKFSLDIDLVKIKINNKKISKEEKYKDNSQSTSEFIDWSADGYVAETRNPENCLASYAISAVSFKLKKKL